ncbi:MAG: hypothetical protein DMH00_09710 [Acidobacteria bacterium]|nr:MAG: hypothetical protein DMH00_09710 [Acidobacteriota bacterium]
MSPVDREGAEAHVKRILQERAAQFVASLEALGREMAEPVSLGSVEEAAPTSPRMSGQDSEAEFLSTLVKGLSVCADQIALLDRLLEGASRCFSRACLFLVRGETAHGWSTVGLPEDETGGDPAGSLKIPLARDSLLKAAADSRCPVRCGELEETPSFLPSPVPGQRIPRQAMAAPILVGDRVSAILYGDDGGDGSCSCNFQWAEILASVASLAAENLALRAGPDSPEVTARADLEIRIPSVEEAAEPSEPSPASELLDPDPLEEELEYTSFAREAPGGPAGLRPDETRQHEDARRFARLLVSELLLYNEDVVIAGRQQRDIYGRLREEIDKSRRAYDQRVPAGIRSRADYFHEELVKTLAAGDPLALGIT